MALQTLIKQPGESRVYAMDFSALLAAGEDISTVDSVTADPAGLTLSGGAVIAGSFVEQRIEGGTVGKTYKVTVVITTNLGNILEGEGLLLVKDL